MTPFIPLPIPTSMPQEVYWYDSTTDTQIVYQHREGNVYECVSELPTDWAQPWTCSLTAMQAHVGNYNDRKGKCGFKGYTAAEPGLIVPEGL